ncbi:hypothetical protein [Arenimonas composti]|uniref:DUF4124 domain-containing protein n=1 Tax=Arenimonas composti TR7-09 = DSM 18010 TaxID=1121013 RepID=A0A091BET3_9GAMM|nr:hypothetical protein [Arenimonas composti]KFN49319.1 hypothetical protein P873_11130 [Arenimonas composti TR7-09 = DSM 18010]
MSRELPVRRFASAAPVIAGRALVVGACALAALAGAPGSAASPGAIQRCLGPDGTTIFTDRSCDSLGATPAGSFHPTPERNAGAPATIGLHGAVGGFATRGCATSPDALLEGVRSAVMAGDVNRLANYYHWAGTGSRAAFALMERLEGIVGRPLAGVELDYPAQPGGYAPDPRDFPASARSPAGGAMARTDAPPRFATEVPEPDARSQPGPAFLASLRRRAPSPPPRPADVPPPVAIVPLERGADAVAAGAPPPSPRASTPRPTGLRILQASSSTDPGSATARFGLRRNAGCWWIEF